MAKKRKNSRRIGAKSEIEAAGRFNALFGTNFRRSQQHLGAPDAPDVIDDDHPEIAIEVKRRIKMNLHEAVEKARSETRDGQTAIVLHRKPGERWLMTVDLFEAPELILELAKILLGGFSATVPSSVWRAAIMNSQFNQNEVELDGIDGKRRKSKERKAVKS